MQEIKNKLVTTKNGTSLLTDIFYDENVKHSPVILYAHGFAGFKDWGNFDIIARKFVSAGFTFVKFNFSLNGTTAETPEEFSDLEAFSKNNYSKRVAEVNEMVAWLDDENNPHSKYIDRKRIGLLGHSLGGGIALLVANTNKAVRCLVTWSAVGQCKTPWAAWPKEKLAEWKTEGVAYYQNSRTNQQMPMGYQLFEDYENNREALDIENAAKKLRIPWLICHATGDTTVPFKTAEKLLTLSPIADLYSIYSDPRFWHEASLESPAPARHHAEGSARNRRFFQQKSEVAFSNIIST